MNVLIGGSYDLGLKTSKQKYGYLHEEVFAPSVDTDILMGDSIRHKNGVKLYWVTPLDKWESCQALELPWKAVLKSNAGAKQRYGYNRKMLALRKDCRDGPALKTGKEGAHPTRRPQTNCETSTGEIVLASLQHRWNRSFLRYRLEVEESSPATEGSAFTHSVLKRENISRRFGSA